MEAFVVGFHGVRYQVKDVSRAVAFYTQHLGGKLEHQQLPALRPGCGSGTRWKSALAASKSR